MSCCCGNAELISIVQGDTLTIILDVTSGADEISKIMFSSDGLNIAREFTHESVVTESGSAERYTLTYTATETALWAANQFTYDITITLTGDTVYTAVYTAPLIIEPKINKTELEG